jgi:NADH-quinone oxidoreductase subunit G/NADP-reducing hydrogenase subunit HndD
MVTIEVNGSPVKANEGLTVLAACRANGLRIPALCHMEGFSPTGACRLCVVEIEGQRGLTPSCATVVAEGMKIKTHSPRVTGARKTIVELLLAGHPDDCLYCSRNGVCELQGLARELGVDDRRFSGAKNRFPLDVSSPSIVRDPDKCILCGRCVRVCEEVQGVGAIDFIGRGCTARVGTAFGRGLNVSTCVNCGQCVTVCPTGALREKSSVSEVEKALGDRERVCVAQHAPAVSVTIGEELGLEPGTDVQGKLNAALRRLGFAKVFDTSFTADLTVMEEGSELVKRIKGGGPLPLLTSCSPGWVKFVEHFYPQLMPNLSTCKSPQQMLGALLKTYYAKAAAIEPKRIYSVSVMPCTAKKFEASRPEMGRDGMADIDAVLTTRELAAMLRKHGVSLRDLAPEPADDPMGRRSGAGKIFGASGGVAEAALRTVHRLVTGEERPVLHVKEARDSDGIKESKVRIGDLTVGMAVVSGLGNARRIMDQVAQGRSDLHFIEVMTCPGGCVNGGGQPFGVDREAVRQRRAALYGTDSAEALRTAHDNPAVQALYRDFLGEPLGEKSHELLHTHYHGREGIG